MPHSAPGVNVEEDGVFVKRTQTINAHAGIVASDAGTKVDLDASGGGGSAIAASLDGTPLTATADGFDATEGLFAIAVANAVTLSVYGAQAGVLASRPAAARSNKRGLYYATDTKTAYVSTGSAWTTLFALGSAAAANTTDFDAAGVAAGLVTAHEADTTAVHGIADTSLLETASGAQAKADAKVSDVAFAVGWDGDTTHAPSKNAVYDKLNNAYFVGGTDVAIADGGTGASTAQLARIGLGVLMGLSRTAVKTANFSVNAGELVPVDTTSGTLVGTLPNAPADQTVVCVKQVIRGGTNTVTINCAGSDTINRTGGVTTLTLTLNGESAWLHYTAAAGVWTLLARDLSLTLLDARYQGIDAELTAFAGLVSAADRLGYFTGSGTMSLATFTSFARTFVAATTAALARTALGLGDMATQNRPALNIGRLNIFGHSWVAGATVGATGTPYMEMQGMLARVAGMFGIHNDNIMNFAQGGSFLTKPINILSGRSYSGWGGVLQYLIPSNATCINDPGTPVITHGPAVPGAGIIVHGINDIGFNTTSYPTQGRNAMKHALRTYLSLSRAGAFYKHKYLNSVFTWDTQFTFSGFATTTAQTNGNSGGAVRGTATNGDYVEFLIPADFRGGTIGVCFIGGKGVYATQNGASIIGATAINLNATLDYLSFANGDIITLGSGTANAEDVRITAGGGTAALTTTAATKAHSSGDPVVYSTGTSKVNWSTSGSNATITGSTQLSGQGYGGTRVSVVQRFVCTAADAGKTIRATVAGFAASEVPQVQFDSVWIEAEFVPPVVVLNVPRFPFLAAAYSNVYAQASNWNADIATVKAEFDANVAIADIDTPIFGKGGTIKTGTTSATQTVTPNVPATWDILAGDTISINGTYRVVQSVTPSGGDYVLVLTSSIATTTGHGVANAEWFHSDAIHWNGVGHGFVAGALYDAFASITGTTSSQLGNTSATWVQDQRSGRTGVIGGAYLQPIGCFSIATAASLNRVHYSPIDVPEECWVTGFAVSTSSAVATAAATVGIYDSDSTGARPGGIIAELGTVTTVTSTIFTQPDVCYVRLRPGRYWTALKSITAAGTFRGTSPSAVPQLFQITPTAGANSGISGYVETFATAGLPATATPVENAGNTAQVMLQLGAAELS